MIYVEDILDVFWKWKTEFAWMVRWYLKDSTQREERKKQHNNLLRNQCGLWSIFSFCVMFCTSLFFLFLFAIIFGCSSIYGFCLPLGSYKLFLSQDLSLLPVLMKIIYTYGCLLWTNYIHSLFTKRGS